MKQTLRKCTAAFFAFLFISLSIGFTSLPVRASFDPPEDIHAEAYAIYNASNDMLLYSQNYDMPIYPASTVKIMSGILAFEYFTGRMDEVITVTSQSLMGSSGNNIKLRVGEEITVDSLLRALIISNANDAANVLAYEIAGSVTSFVVLMNEKAKELGCENTFFVNPTGLDDKSMHTSVHDLILISKYVSGNVEYLELTATDYCILPATNKSEERTISNNNHLVSTFYYTKYFNVLAKGLNAGATDLGGYCCVGLIRKYGVNYIVVAMNSDFDSEIQYHYCYRDADTLLEWAYKNYSYINIVDTTTMVCEIPVSLSSTADHVTLLPEQPIEIYLPADADLANDVYLTYDLFASSMSAPVKQGQIAGILTAKYQGKLVATVNLIAKNDVPRSEFLFYLYYLKQLFVNPISLFLIILILICAVGLVFLLAYLRGRRQRELAAKRHRYTRKQPAFTHRTPKRQTGSAGERHEPKRPPQPPYRRG